MKFKYNSIDILFNVFEHLPVVLFSSSANSSNHSNVYVPASYLSDINQFFAFNLFFNHGFLCDQSAVDLNKTNETWLTKIFKKIKNQLLVFSTYYIYWTKIRLTIFSLLPIKTNKKLLCSAETLYFNSNWLERELSEMYGIYFFQKKDSRNLLLTYSTSENPMLKRFPCEGFDEVYYNFFESNVVTIAAENIEL